MNETSRMSGLFRYWSRYLLCGIGLLLLVMTTVPLQAGWLTDVGDTPAETQAHTEIVNAIEPDGDLPGAAGEMVMIARNRAGGDTTYMTPAEVSASVDTLAYPHLAVENMGAYGADTEFPMLRGSTDVVQFKAWNLGNDTDVFEIKVESREEQYDTFGFDLIDAEGGVIGAVDESADSHAKTGEISSVVDLDSDTPWEEIGLRIQAPMEEDKFNDDTITVTLRTTHPDSAWESSSRGQQEDTFVFRLTEQEPNPLYFVEPPFADRTRADGKPIERLRAQQPRLVEDTLPVRLWSEDLDGNKLSGLDITLEFLEDNDLAIHYEAKFGFTEGHSRKDDHPKLPDGTPFVEVGGETTIIHAEIREGIVTDYDPGSDSAVWTPDPDPEHVDTLDEVRTWPSPFKPLEGDPFVFQDLPADDGMEIFLYNVQGQMVRRLTVGRGIDFHELGNKARWWGKNDRGSYVASGTYVYVIKSQYGVERGKVTLVK